MSNLLRQKVDFPIIPNALSIPMDEVKVFSARHQPD